jgi:hypothetical protein
MQGLNEFLNEEVYITATDADENVFLVKAFKDEKTAKETVWDEDGDLKGKWQDVMDWGYYLSVDKKKPKKDLSSDNKKAGAIIESLNEGFKVDDVVYNTRTNTVGIVRMEEDRGEVKTDADGNVDVDELEKYNEKKHKDADIAPSTKKEIAKRKLNEAEELNEASKEATNAIKLLTNFDKAFRDLVGDMEDDSEDIYNDAIGDGYPFEDSFDDLYHVKVKKWIADSIKNLKKA